MVFLFGLSLDHYNGGPVTHAVMMANNADVHTKPSGHELSVRPSRGRVFTSGGFYKEPLPDSINMFSKMIFTKKPAKNEKSELKNDRIESIVGLHNTCD